MAGKKAQDPEYQLNQEQATLQKIWGSSVDTFVSNCTKKSKLQLQSFSFKTF